MKAMREKSEHELVLAKQTEEQTEQSLAQIEALRKDACAKAAQLKNMSPQNLQEIAKETNVCQTAAAATDTARDDMRKRAKTVAAAAEEAKAMESKYAAEEDKMAATLAMQAEHDAVKLKVSEAHHVEELHAVEAMITIAHTEVNKAVAMTAAAQHTKNLAALEIAGAASAAAAEHLKKLEDEKVRLSSDAAHEKSELGELGAEVTADAEKIKRMEAKDTLEEVKLGQEHDEALGESEAASEKREIETLQARIIDVANQVKRFANQGRLEEKKANVAVASLTSEIKLEDNKLDKLHKLVEVATHTLEDTTSKTAIDRAHHDYNAVDLDVKKQAQNEIDLVKVNTAIAKVQAERESKKRQLDDEITVHNVDVSVAHATTTFSERVLGILNPL